MQLSDFQFVILVLGILAAVGIVGYVSVLLARHRTDSVTALLEQVRADRPTMDFLETLGRDLVPVSQIYLMAAFALPFIPAGTDEEKKLRNVALDILKSLSDGLPWTPPKTAVTTTTVTPAAPTEATGSSTVTTTTVTTASTEPVSLPDSPDAVG